jgi:hypothetical protein
VSHRVVVLSSILLSVVVGGCAEGAMPPRDSGPPPELDAGRMDSGRPPPRPDAGVDAGTDGGPVELVRLCETCSLDAQCGTTARCGPLSGGERVCLRLCDPEFNDCPRGFQCAAYAPLDFQNVCLPVGAVCCIDEDADGYGIGGQCMGEDCDDADIGRFPGAEERCDGADQDCDERVDEDYVDCEPQRCLGDGTGRFQEVAAASCEEATCMDPVGTACALYTCVGGGEAGDTCATTCAPEGADEDRFCIAAAHCDAATCDPDVADGGVCDEDSDCESGNCENGFCCGRGLTCCGTGSDCPGFPGVGTVCNEPTRCQGTRGTVMCETSTASCTTASGIPDDTACTSDVIADGCGFFRDLRCTGAADQPEPRCPSTCTSDTECDGNAHCFLNTCFPDRPDGEACTASNQCASGHCQNGFCCAGGDCCATASNCPASYGSAPVCNDTRACQGTRNAAVCTASRCGTVMNVPDDSACHAGIVADECGLYPAVRCNGSVEQTAPVCAMTCSGHGDCDPGAHCRGGICQPDLSNGAACTEARQCASRHCQNGFCCASGDCCARATDCPSSYARPSECLASGSCQGSRRDAVCNAGSQCQLSDPIDDDSGCNGLVSNECGLFPAVRCTAEVSQPTDQMARCATMCSTTPECDPGAFCNGMMTCQSQGMPGDACSGPGQCAGGLPCVDGVCCTSACTGTCVACNLAGSRGTCTPIPNGQDPSSECGGLSCTSYFHGWSGSTCFERADASAAAVSCNGSGSCQTAADVCPSQPRGNSRLTCNSSCQSINGSTCVGTTAPTCNNLNPGNQTCGLGVCQREVPLCVGGSPNTCVPGMSSTEVCNGADDDCDGTADNNIPSARDSFEPNETCAERRALTRVTTDGASGSRTASATATVYFDGDVDIYQIRVDEDGASDCVFNCGVTARERSTLSVTIRVPAGVGSYEICGGNGGSCPSTWGSCQTVPGGTERTIVLRGPTQPCTCIIGCTTDNSETFYLRVRGVGAPRWSCLPYTLSYTADEECG